MLPFVLRLTCETGSHGCTCKLRGSLRTPTFLFLKSDSFLIPSERQRERERSKEVERVMPMAVFQSRCFKKDFKTSASVEELTPHEGSRGGNLLSEILLHIQTDRETEGIPCISASLESLFLAAAADEDDDPQYKRETNLHELLS